jgi:hypothetical protein
VLVEVAPVIGIALPGKAGVVIVGVTEVVTPCGPVRLADRRVEESVEASFKPPVVCSEEVRPIEGRVGCNRP